MPGERRLCEKSVIRAATHKQQHETGAGFGRAAWVLVWGSLGSVREAVTFNKYPGARLKFCAWFKLGLQPDPSSHLINLIFAINCDRNSG